MAKVLSDNSVSDNKKYSYMGNGIFIEKIKIESVVDKSNYPLAPVNPKNTIGNNGYAPELCLVISEGERNYYIFGNYDYNEDKISGNKKYKGWKRSGNSVWSLLFTLLGDKAIINDNDTIPSSTLYLLKDKEFYKLRYCIGGDKDTGKPLFKDYPYFESADNEENKNKLYEKFIKSYYAQNYHDPNYYDEYSHMKEYSSSSPNNENGKDNDLPF